MRFKSIEIYGFKSFAEKVVIPFEEGITDIVGPNGCGKSNVADAIRWVLGEQSPKLLRGSSMQDVIFAGTETRKQLSYCEVSLNFDNTEPRVFANTPFDEIKITRKLFRNGNSEYLVNGIPRLLKDIKTMVRDTGLGREGYSIVGQGRIQDIIQAKPEARRSIFDDAAGVLNMKQSKRVAENKMATAQESINTYQLLIDQQGSQLETLEKKAESAKKFLQIRDDLRILESNAYIYQYENNESQKEKFRSKLDGTIELLDVKTNESESLSKNFEEVTKEQQRIDNTISGIKDELLQMAVRNEKITGQGNTITERLNNLKNSKNEYSNNQLKLEESFDKKSEEYREVSARHKMCLDEKSILDQEFSKVSREQSKIVDFIISKQGQMDSKQAEILKTLESLGDIKANLGKIKAERQGCIDRVSEINIEIENNQNDVDAEENNKISIEASLSKLKKDCDRLKLSKDSIFKDLTSTKGQVEFLQNNIQTKTMDVGNAKTRLKIYEDMQSTLEGFGPTIKNLMSAAKTDQEVNKRILGVVGNVIEVSQEYEVAIEKALGGHMQEVITATDMDAKFLIEYLKNNRLGQATFDPINSMKPRDLSPSFNMVLREEGCIGIASKIIKYDPRFNNIFSNLLGSTVICEDLESGIYISRKYGYSFKIVTLDGDVINNNGSLNGGSRRNDTPNRLGHAADIASLKKLIEDFTKNIESSKIRLSEVKKEEIELQEQYDEYIEEIKNAEIKIATENGKLEKIVGKITDKLTANSNYSAAKLILEEKIKAFDLAISRVDEEGQNASSSRSTVDEEAARNRAELDEANKEKTIIDSKVSELKIKMSANDEKIASLEKDIIRIEKEKEEISKSISLCKEFLMNNEVDIKKVSNELNNTVVAKEDETRKKELDDTIKDLESRKSQIVSELSLMNEKSTALSKELMDLAASKSKLESGLERIDETMRTLATNLAEDYELDYDSALQYKNEGFVYTQGMQEISKLKKSKAALGSVDLGSIQEYQDQSADYHAKIVQRDDLLKTKMDLQKIISELTDEISTRFNAEFVKINNNFKVIFPELFGGGNGNLVLLPAQEEQDPLDAGIDIFMEPPGKKVQSITLFSGGEQSLCGLAILFSILKLRSMPFCVLDEVEAALDEGNVAVYANYVKKYASETQFICITHRKPTMECANRLYGVTMQEKGVSRIVSVSLENAIEQIGKE